MSKPVLLRIPKKFQTVEAVLDTAAQLELPNILVLSEKEDGSIIFLGTEMSLANTNWLLDRLKSILLEPGSFERVGP